MMNPFHNNVFEAGIVWLNPITAVICTSAILTLGKVLQCISKLLWKTGVYLSIVLQG